MVLFLFSISLEVYKLLQQAPTQTVFPDRSDCSGGENLKKNSWGRTWATVTAS